MFHNPFLLLLPPEERVMIEAIERAAREAQESSQESREPAEGRTSNKWSKVSTFFSTAFVMFLGLLSTISLGASLGTGLLFSLVTLASVPVALNVATYHAAGFLGVLLVAATGLDRRFNQKFFLRHLPQKNVV